MVMRSASKTARKLTFRFGIFCVDLPVRRVFPIEALSSVARAINFGLVADEAPRGFGDTV